MRKSKVFKLIILVGVMFAVWVIWGNTALEFNQVIIESKEIPEEFSGFRIAHISDYHNTESDHLNESLLEILKEEEPDMIAITGDLIDSRRTNIDAALRFAEQAVKIAPCYYVTGNHESRIDDLDMLRSGLTVLGVNVLENERMTLQKEKGEITILGVSDPRFMTREIEEEDELIKQCLNQLSEEDDAYRILLSHRPEMFDLYKQMGMDLVLSGHAHGGQFRLPILGGLVAPHQGFFPKYDAGIFTEGETSMVVSRGIGNSIVPIRVNNRPEAVMVELRYDDQ